jgi:hypothetical protein
MAVVVVGGHSRNVGKTSVVAGIIAALPECHWTAMKITQYGHGVCSKNGKSCQCATADHSWAFSEEKDPKGKSDTCRFLAAGATHVYWVRTQQGHLEQAWSTIRLKIAEVENSILESNSVLQLLQPHVYLTVLDPETEDFKASARKYLERADAILLHKSASPAAWADVPKEWIAEKPVFEIKPPDYVTFEIADFVRQKLAEIKS